MLGNAVKLRVNGTKKPPRARTIGISIVVGWVVFVTVYLLLWEHAPSWQLVLNRISWSSSDYISLAATALALYTYYLVQKSSQSEDMKYLSEFVFTLRKVGIDPREAEKILRQTQGLVKLVSEDPETAKRVEQATFRILREKYAGLAKLNDEEMYETLRSLIR